jgi:3D (Asp-Asp-Asp) domain-containing protein
MNLLLALLLLFSQIPRTSAFYQEPILQPRIDTPSSQCVILSQVTLVFEDTESVLHTCTQTVKEFLVERGIDLNTVEFEDARLWTGKRVVAVSVERTRTLTWQKIPYAVEEEYVTTLAHREKKYTQKGKNGVRGIIMETTRYPNGKVVEKRIKKWVENEPVTQKVQIGSQYRMQKATVDGKTIWYWKTLTVTATSYDKNCEGCNDTTATGAKLTKGIIAVDPKVIPLHTRMYVPGYGYGKAEDVGGAVKGNKIDLAYDDLRYGDWSKRSVTIYIID